MSKRRSLREVIEERLSAHQEDILRIMRVYPKHLHRGQLEYLHKDSVRRTVEAVLNHMRAVEVEERAELERELFEGGQIE